MNAALKAEWIKLSGSRALSWTLLAYMVLTVGLSVLFGVTTDDTQAGAPGFDPIRSGLRSVPMGMTLLVIVGVLLVTNEYATGTIRASLLAVPDRARFYGAKLALLALVVGAVSTLATTTGFVAVQILLGEHRAAPTPQTVGHVVGAVLYIVCIVLFCAGIATLLRSTAATLSILLPLFFMVSTILGNIPGLADVAQFLPDVAGSHVLRQDTGQGVLGPWTGMGVLAVWTALAVAAGYAVTSHRDA